MRWETVNSMAVASPHPERAEVIETNASIQALPALLAVGNKIFVPDSYFFFCLLRCYSRAPSST